MSAMDWVVVSALALLVVSWGFILSEMAEEDE